MCSWTAQNLERGWRRRKRDHAKLHRLPGAIYDARGRSLDRSVPDLLQEDIDACPHQSLVTDRDAAPVARVWLLADDATPRAVPSCIMAEAVQLVLTGRGVLILARRPEVEADVRDGLLQALDLVTVTEGEGGRA